MLSKNLSYALLLYSQENDEIVFHVGEAIDENGKVVSKVSDISNSYAVGAEVSTLRLNTVKVRIRSNYKGPIWVGASVLNVQNEPIVPYETTDVSGEITIVQHIAIPILVPKYGKAQWIIKMFNGFIPCEVVFQKKKWFHKRKITLKFECLGCQPSRWLLYSWKT